MMVLRREGRKARRLAIATIAQKVCGNWNPFLSLVVEG